MMKEYKTIREVVGPLMMVSGVSGVAYDELGEIELPNGDLRRCKVLEMDGENALTADLTGMIAAALTVTFLY